MQIIGQIIIPNVYSLYPDTMQIYYKQSSGGRIFQYPSSRQCSDYKIHPHVKYVLSISWEAVDPFGIQSVLCQVQQLSDGSRKCGSITPSERKKNDLCGVFAKEMMAAILGQIQVLLRRSFDDVDFDDDNAMVVVLHQVQG